MSALNPAIHGVVVYLILCSVTVLVGRGFLRILRFRDLGRGELLLTPVFTLVLWTLVLGVTGAAGVPTRLVTPPLWGVSLLLALLGLASLRGTPRLALLPLLVCLLTPLVAMPRWFGTGLLDQVDVVAGDGWCYVATGKWMWQCGLGETAAGPHILHQAVGMFGKIRYISYGLLGHLSPLVCAGDTLAVAPLLYALALFCLSCGVYRTFSPQGAGAAVVATVLTGVGGWLADVRWLNNSDHALALVYMPALAAVAGTGRPFGAARWVLLGGLAAGLVYTYVECAPFVFVGAALLALPGLLAEKPSRRLLGGLLVSGGVAVALLLPAARVLRGHFASQLATVSRGVRPAEGVFDAMLELRRWPSAFWGLGGETYAKAQGVRETALGWGLSLCLGCGVVVLLRRRRWELPATAALLDLGALYLLVGQRFPYAAYKLHSLNWWCLGGIAGCGCAWLARRCWALSRPTAVALGGLGVVALVLATMQSQPSFLPDQRLQDYRPLLEVRDRVGNQALALAIDDATASYLAIYYLGDLRTYLLAPRLWLALPAWVEAFNPLDGGAAAQVRTLLTDVAATRENPGPPPGRLLWQGGRYRLWELGPDSPAVALLGLLIPLPANSQQQMHAAWDGTLQAIVTVFARRNGILHLKADFRQGPGQPRRDRLNLDWSVEGGLAGQVVLRAGPAEVLVRVKAGLNRIRLRGAGMPVVFERASVTLE